MNMPDPGACSDRIVSSTSSNPGQPVMAKQASESERRCPLYRQSLDSGCGSSMPSTNWLKTMVSEWPFGKVTSTIGEPSLADLSVIKEKLGVLSMVAVEAKDRTDMSTRSFIVVLVN